MNTTDLRSLLAAPTVSRAAFFSEFLGEPGEPGKLPCNVQYADDAAAKEAAELPAPPDDAPTATGFPA